MYIINFTNDWIQAADLYYWKQPLCQLSLHRCLKEKEFGNEKERERKFKKFNEPTLVHYFSSFRRKIDEKKIFDLSLGGWGGFKLGSSE